MMDGLDIIDQKIIQKNYKMKKGILMIALIIYAITSCQESRKANDNINNSKSTISKKEENQDIDFLKSVQDICVEDDGVFKNCGELFTKDGASLFFIILPKIGAKKWYDEQTKNLKGEIYEVNNLLIEKVKKSKPISDDFDVWVFFTDKKYTKYIGMDSPYNLKIPRITDLYYLNSTKNWEKLQSFKVSSEKDDIKENEWRTNYIDKIINESNTKNQISKISDKWIGKYSMYLSYGKIGDQNTGWALDIEITKENIIATGEGYQIGFRDLLTAKENDSKLILNHLENLSGYDLGAKMIPEFTIIEYNNKYFIRSKWIDSDIITKPEKNGYLIEKK